MNNYKIKTDIDAGTVEGVHGDSQYLDIPDWGHVHVTDAQGEPLILRRVPTDLPLGQFSTFGISDLSPDQGREGNAFHELGHAIAYLHFGAPVAISMRESKENKSSAHVVPWGQELEKMNHQQRRIALAAGEWAELRWLKENDLWSPLEEYVMEVRARSDRRALREILGVKFEEAPTSNGFDDLLAETDRILSPYWDFFKLHAPELARSDWWGWDEAAERLGFAHLLEVEHRAAAEGIRDSFNREDGVHHFEYNGFSVTVTRKGGDWKSVDVKNPHIQ